MTKIKNVVKLDEWAQSIIVDPLDKTSLQIDETKSTYFILW